MLAAATLAAGGARADRRALVATTGTVLTVFAVGAAVQTAYAFGNPTSLGPAFTMVLERVVANLGAVVTVLTMLVATGAHRTTSLVLLAVRGLAAGVTAAVVRVALQQALGVYAHPSASIVLIELVSGAAVACISIAIGIGSMISRRNLRTHVAQSAHSALQIELALQALQYEEVRVRREVAEGLHGSVQQRLVLIVARLDRILEHAARADGPLPEPDIAMLREIRAEVETVRESDVRSTSRMLYPDQLEVGMVPAVRSLMGRIPATVRTRLVVSDALRTLDDPAAPLLTQSERLLAVRIVEEAVTNALRHGRASSIEVHLATAQDGAPSSVPSSDGQGTESLLVEVTDDGAGFDSEVGGPRSGLSRLRDRLALAGGFLEVTSSPGAGASVRARMPVRGRSAE